MTDQTLPDGKYSMTTRESSVSDRIALVDKDGVVVAVGGPREDSWGTIWISRVVVTEFIMDGGTVQHVPDSVQAGDPWPGVCEWTTEHAGTDDAYRLSGCKQSSMGTMEFTYLAAEFCPGCGLPVSVTKEDG